MNLEVKNGSFGYGKKILFDNVNFTISENEILTILGPNGAGKTTLLKCIMGFLRWKSGVTFLNDKKINAYKDNEFWKKTSYVPQAKHGVFSYRVIDAVIMGLNANQSFFSTPKQEDYDKAESTLRTLGVSKLIDKYCNDLSGGELQMVIMARALVSKPELLILDEPESNLDMKNQLRIIDAIEMAKEEFETSCLINTHFPNHALKISDNTLMMGYNNKKLYGKTLDMVTEGSIREFFDVNSKVVSLEAGEETYKTIFPYEIVNKTA